MNYARLMALAAATAFHLATTGCDAPASSSDASSAKAPAGSTPAQEAPLSTASIAVLPLRTLDGAPTTLGAHAGKVILLVNVASACGYTPQYKGLEELWRRHRDQGLVVIGVPSNDFGGQEPGTAEEIATFCSTNYGVTFPLLEKMHVKSGETQSELYRKLVQKTGSAPTWNFCKYLVHRDGSTIEFFDSKADPCGPRLQEAVTRALNER